VDRNDPVHVALGNQRIYHGVFIGIPSIDFAVFARDVFGVDHDIWKNDKDGMLYLSEAYELLEAAETSHLET